MVVRKRSPEEKMGVIARIDGRTGVVECSDLPDELAQMRDADGELAYWAGSVAVHCIEVAFVRELTEAGCAFLPPGGEGRAARGRGGPGGRAASRTPSSSRPSSSTPCCAPSR